MFYTINRRLKYSNSILHFFSLSILIPSYNNSLPIGYHLGIISLNNNGSLILSRSPVKYPCAPPSQTVLGKEPDPVTLAITSSGEASGNSDLYSAAAPAT